MNTENNLTRELFKLIQSDQRLFEFIYQSPHDGLWLRPLASTKDEWWAPAIFRMLGYNDEAHDGEAGSIKAIMNADDFAKSGRLLEEHVQNNEVPYEQNIRFTQKDGSVVLVAFRGIAVQENGGQKRIAGTFRRITHDKKDKVILKETIKRYESILNSQSTYVVRISIDGKYTYANETFYKRFRTTPAEVIGFSSLEKISEEDQELCRHTGMKCVENPGTTFPVVLRKRIPGGRVMVTQWDFICIPDEDGRPSEIQCVGYDITDRLDAEAEVKRTSLELEGFFNTSLDLLCIASPDGRFEKINKSWEDFLGYPLDKLQGSEILAYVHPEDQELTRAEWGRIREGNEIAAFTNRLRSKDQSDHYIQWRCILKNGRIYSAARDITSDILNTRRIEESEALLSSFYNTAPMMMGIVELLEDDIIHVRDNDLSLRFFGRSHEEMKNARATLLNVSRETIDLWTHHYKTSEQTGKPSGFEYEHFYNGISSELSVTVTCIGPTASGRKRYAYIVNDITDRKHAEQLAIKTEKKYHDLLTTIPIGVFEFEVIRDGSFVVTFASPRWFEITGIMEDELRENRFLPLRQLHPADADSFYRNFHKAAAAGENFLWEGRKIINEKVKYVLIQATITRRSDGVLVVNGIEKDITERKEAEILLRATKAELERKTTELDMTLAASGIGIWEMDMQSNKLSWDKHLRRMFEGGDEQLNYDSWKRVVHPEDIHEVEEVFRKFMNRESEYDVEYRIFLSDGSIRYHNSKAILFADDSGTITRVKGISADITKRKEIELELAKTRWVLEKTNTLARVGGWEYDLRNNQIFWSSITREIFGLNHAFRPTPENHLSFFEEGESKTSITRALDRAIQMGEPWDLELKVVRGDGFSVWVRSIGKPDFRNGKCHRVLGAIQDVQQQKQAEQKILLAQKQAEAGSRAKSEFLSNMSHEIRTPLNGVIGFADLMMKTPLDRTQQEYMSTLHYSANSLLDIINDILDFSKIEAGKLELNIQQADLHKIGDEAADIIKYLAHKKSIELLVNLGPDLPPLIMADEVRLRQILVNLLSNASKFTSEGEIELKIERLSEAGPGRAKLRFSVRDTGIGIAPENQVKIFEAFSQEDSTISRRFGGTGLGLTISNKLLALMGSNLNLVSEPGSGSTFWFEITAEVVSEGQDQEKSTLVEIRRVLVVDDHDQNRYLLCRMLGELKIHSDEANSGDEALNMIRRRKYDAVILDYNMPGVSGTETVRRLRAEQSESSPVILLYSSVDDELLKTECEHLGIRNRIIKPVKKQQLKEALLCLRTGGDVTSSSSALEEGGEASLTVLIADDNPTNILLTRSILLRINPSIRILEAEDGQAAVETFFTEFPDIVFMDIQMPVKSGYEAVEEIRQREKGRRTPIVALTAGTVKGEKEKCLAAGMDDYLSKPVVKNSIERILSTWTRTQPYKQTPTYHAANHFDLQQLLKTFDFDKGAVDEIVRIGKREIAGSISILSTADYEDLNLIRTTAHKLKGTSLNISCMRLAALAYELEQSEMHDRLLLKQKVQRILDEYDVVLNLMHGNAEGQPHASGKT